MQMQHQYCSTRSPNWTEFRRKFDNNYYKSAELKDCKDVIYISTRYVVLYGNDEQKLPINFVKAGHSALNEAFIAQNIEELKLVPDNDKYPWKPLVGNPNIQFLPLDSTKLSVEYMKISSSSLSNTSPVEDAAKRAGVKSKVLNIYIGNSTQGILGQAELSSNIVFVLYSALGNTELPGQLNGYHLSKTLVHEVGHALSLPHTFSDDSCDHQKVFPDVPEQINPNFHTEIIVDEQGNTTCVGDNRYMDREDHTNKSCLSIQSHPDTAPNEMGINYMDYGKDTVSIMFTKSQALMMRTFLRSPENTKLELKTETSESDNTTDQPDVPDNGVVEIDEGDVPSTSDENGLFINDSNALTGLSIALIVLVGVVMIVFLIALIIYFYDRKKKPASDRPNQTNIKKKKSDSYRSKFIF